MGCTVLCCCCTSSLMMSADLCGSPHLQAMASRAASHGQAPGQGSPPTLPPDRDTGTALAGSAAVVLLMQHFTERTAAC